MPFFVVLPRIVNRPGKELIFRKTSRMHNDQLNGRTCFPGPEQYPHTTETTQSQISTPFTEVHDFLAVSGFVPKDSNIGTLFSSMENGVATW